jgi:uncharacterized protein
MPFLRTGFATDLKIANPGRTSVGTKTESFSVSFSFVRGTERGYRPTMGKPFFSRWLGLSGTSPSNPTFVTHTAGTQEPEEQFNLGRQFATGVGADQSYTRAAECYLVAARQGHCESQFSLGMMYGQGQGVLRNEASAVEMFRLAAELGHAGAQYQLGVRRFRASKSGPKAEASECRVESLKWLQLAAAQGYRRADSPSEFAALDMTREEVDEAGRRAQTFEQKK